MQDKYLKRTSDHEDLSKLQNLLLRYFPALSTQCVYEAFEDMVRAKDNLISLLCRLA
jgi:hypothetical protein